MTILDHAPVAAKAAAEVNGETYSRLINLSGRRRFTSQRVVLFAVLAAQGRQGALTASQEALNVFAAAHRALTEGGDGLPGLFCTELREAHLRGAGDQIDSFIAVARETHDALESRQRVVTELLPRLIEMSTPLLAVLNALTQTYEDLGRRFARQERARMVALLEDMQRIAKQARIVSFNARVVAARSAEAGREFAVVASELLRITTQMDELAREAAQAA